MKRVLFVATVVRTHIMEFHTPYLRMFKNQGWETAVAARNDYENPADCVIPYCDKYFDVPFARSPFKVGKLLQAYSRLKRIVDSESYDIIHCHTPVGALLARLAARGARKKGTRLIYTAHGFHFYKGAPLLNRLLYYPLEKMLSRNTDTLITVNREDYGLAQRFYAKEVRYVHGVGVDTQKFGAVLDREKNRRKLGLREDDFALLSVGELIPRKNHRVVLLALAELKKRGTLENTVYFICGSGILKDKLEALAGKLGVSENVRFLGYREDIPEICSACDLFVFMSKQEGLPVALMEAMASGLPCVCSQIRGNTDLIRDNESGYLIPDTPPAVADAIAKLRECPLDRARLSKQARERVKEFDIKLVEREMYEIYFPSAER